MPMQLEFSTCPTIQLRWGFLRWCGLVPQRTTPSLNRYDRALSNPMNFGVVAIGRNEGERLKRGLASVPAGTPTVYVDSGSTDGSAQWARGHGANVIELDVSIPFTAARARNAGFQRLKEITPGLRFVQFIDGDCELEAKWLESAE